MAAIPRNAAAPDRSRSIRAILHALALIAGAFAAAAAHGGTLDFEGLPSGLTLVNQFQDVGVSFNGPQVTRYPDQPAFAHSGSQVLELCRAAEFCSTPLVLRFGQDQLQVSAFVGSSYALSEPRTVSLKAYDQNDVLVAQSAVTLPPSANPVPATTALSVTVAIPAIRRAVISFESSAGVFNNGLVIDDISYDRTSYYPCYASGLPSLTVDRPVDKLSVSANSFLTSGHVASPSGLVEASLTVATPGYVDRRVELLGSLIDFGGGDFATQLAGTLAPGENRLTYHVQNCRGPTDVSRTAWYGPVPAGTKIDLALLEIVQATQFHSTSPLVADKPTLVRAYLTPDMTSAPIFRVTGDLVVHRVGSQAAVQEVHPINVITLDSQGPETKRIDPDRTLNFLLPASLTSAGTYDYEITNLKVDGYVGLDCDSCRERPGFASPRGIFQSTKPLKIVLAPFLYQRHPVNRTPNLLFPLMGSLQWLNNVYPLSGNFPADDKGIHLLRILPMRSTNLDLSYKAPGQGIMLNQLASLRFDMITFGLMPVDAPLLAVVPCSCGGKARHRSGVAFAHMAAVEEGMISAASYNGLGGTIAHELGHLFGREHAGNAHRESDGGDVDPNFDSPHGGIVVPGVAISTEWWYGHPYLLAPGIAADNQLHTHDFMSYGTPPEWVSPYTYAGLFRKFAVASNAYLGVVRAPSAIPVNRLVAFGTVMPGGKSANVTTRVVMTAYSIPRSNEGPYRIELLDGAGKPLAFRQFTPEQTSDGGELAFEESMNWRPGTRMIRITGPTGVLLSRKVSAHAPTISYVRRLNAHSKGRATIAWEANDVDGDRLEATVFYRPSASQPWLPLGVTESSSLDIDTRFVPGGRMGEVRVRVSDGLRTSDSNARMRFLPHAPEVAILGSPVLKFSSNERIELSGFAYDAEDGLLTGKNLSWRGANGRVLGEGGRLVLERVSPGPRNIYLRATDNDGSVSEATIRIDVRDSRFLTTPRSPSVSEISKAH